MRSTVTDRILRRVRGKGRGWVFTPKDFLDFGSRAAVDQALSRLVRAGKIRRIARGIYDFPKVSKRLGVLSPSDVSVAMAIARKTNSKLYVSDAQAANALGLTTQLSAKPVYLTDGPSKKLQIGNRQFVFQHTRSVGSGNKDRWVQFARQALNFVGRDGFDDQVADRILRIAHSRQVTGLLLRNVPSWAQTRFFDRLNARDSAPTQGAASG